jgi:hypothetical protein
MVGTLNGTDQWFRRGAASTGLTDYGVGLDGTILQWNDPTGKAHAGVSANRAGHANGGSDGLEGDGPLYVRTQGVNAINRDLVSIERDDQGDPYTQPVPKDQRTSIVRICAYWHDQDEVPYSLFPLNPKRGGGIVTQFFHKEFATKGCPWGPVEEQINLIQDEIRAILQAAQVPAGEVPVPPKPPDPDHGQLPADYTAEGLSDRFGTLIRKHVDGHETEHGFSMRGAVSNAWIARGDSENRKMVDLPPASLQIDHPEAKGLQSSIILFDGRGADNWVLHRPDPSIAWRWAA